MTHFTGFCSYPHGGWLSAGLLFASCGGFVAVTYGVASCRLAVISFISTTGNFEETFARDNGQEGVAVAYRASIGLYQWLRPFDFTDPDNWAEGSCVGYQQSMLSQFTESTFETARGFGALAVMLSTLVVLWGMVTACLAWNLCQIMLLCVVLLSTTLATGMAFIFFESDLCNNVLDQSECELDEGGLVLVAGLLLWMTSFLIAVFFLRPLDMPDLTDIAEYEQARQRAEGKARLQRAHAYLKEERKRKEEAEISSNPGRDVRAVPTPDTIRSQSFDFGDSPRNTRSPPTSPTRRYQSAPVYVSAVENVEEDISLTRTPTNNIISFLKPTRSRRQRTPLEGVGSDLTSEEVTVDDVSRQNELEVYISDRVNRINEILKDIKEDDVEYQRTKQDDDTRTAAEV